MLNIGGLYSVNVGMSYKIVVGQNMSTSVAKDIQIEAVKVFEVKVGKSVLRMDDSGKVTIIDTEFVFEASGPVQISGKDIDLN